jgi:lysophospholipase L1-like esterase
MLRRSLFVLASVLVLAALSCKRQPDTSPSPEGSSVAAPPTVSSAAAPVGTTLPAPPPPAPPKGNAAVRFIGRFDMSDPGGPRYAWSGSTINARFRGTEATIKLRDSAPNVYTVWVDDRPPVKLVVKDQRAELARGLAPGEHEITVAKNGEALLGDGQFIGLDLGKDGALLPPRVPSRRIEFVGDSITAGSGSEGEHCDAAHASENVEIAYSALTARALGADANIIAYSAKGVSRNGGGDPETMPVLYTRTIPGVATSQWNFASWIPDAVVVALGTNDFAAGDPGAKFPAAYRAFLETIRKNYPNAQIVCAIGPMLVGANLAAERRYVSEMVKAVNDAGDAKVHFVEFPHQDVAHDGVGCGNHPGPTTHRKMAAQLSAVLAKTMGW